MFVQSEGQTKHRSQKISQEREIRVMMTTETSTSLKEMMRNLPRLVKGMFSVLYFDETFIRIWMKKCLTRRNCKVKHPISRRQQKSATKASEGPRNARSKSQSRVREESDEETTDEEDLIDETPLNQR